MEIQPFEHYDYIVLFFRHSLDFERALERFKIGKRKYTVRTNSNWDSGKCKIGIGRVIDGARALEALND